MQEQNNSEFNPEKLHNHFKELWKNADKLDRGQYTHYESFSKSFFLLDMQRAVLLQCAIDLCSFTNVDCDDIEFNDTFLNMAWVNITPNIRSNYKKWIDSKKGVEAKAAKNTKKNTKPKTKSNTKKSTVKSSPVDSEDIKQNAEVVNETTKSENKDLSREDSVSFIHLKLNIDASLALQIYQYRVLKKVSNSESALEKFCEQIKNGVAQSQIPIIKVVNHYCEGKWKEFKDSWAKELVDTQSNVDIDVPVVEVADKTISLLIDSLDISKDYAENIIQFRKTHNLSNNEMVLLNWCSEISKASHLAERSVNDVLDFIFLKNYKSFNASWFVDYVSSETESMKKKKASDKVDILNESGLSYLPQYRKEKLIRQQRATNDRLGIPNPPYSDSSDINAKEEIKLLFNQDENNE